MDIVVAIEHIVRDPNKHNGRPYIAGKGVTVQYIAELHNLDWTVADLIESFDLTLGQVYAALSYYFDHKTELDQMIQDGQAKAQEALQASGALSADEMRSRIEARRSGH